MHLIIRNKRETLIIDELCSIPIDSISYIQYECGYIRIYLKCDTIIKLRGDKYPFKEFKELLKGKL